MRWFCGLILETTGYLPVFIFGYRCICCGRWVRDSRLVFRLGGRVHDRDVVRVCDRCRKS
jgi:hypothetical protein